jgi:hypothetical protein
MQCDNVRALILEQFTKQLLPEQMSQEVTQGLYACCLHPRDRLDR